VANFSLITVLYCFRSVRDVWSLVVGIRVAIEMLNVTTMWGVIGGEIVARKDVHI